MNSVVSSFVLSASQLAPSLMLLNQFLEIFTLVIAPILVIYAFVAYRGHYQSRSLPVLILLAVLIPLSGVFHISVAFERYANFSEQALFMLFFENLARVTAMLALLFIFRGYVHSEIKLIESGSWVPPEMIQKCRECKNRWFKLHENEKKKK